MKYLKIQLFLLLFVNHNVICMEIKLPDNAAIDGWEKSGAQMTFYKNDLYGHINGGAELFLEFGFDSLLVQDYNSGGALLSLEVYCMETTESALGIYLMKCGKETSSPEIESRNSANKYQVLAVKDKFYIQLNNFKGSKEAEKVMPVFLNAILSNISGKNTPGLIKLLPEENMVPGSEKIIRGQYALQPIFTFGDGDVLQLEGKIFAVAADYKPDGNDLYTQLIIPYSDNERAKFVFENVKENLDPYLIVLEQKEDGLVFQDYQKKYGKITVNDDIIYIMINVSYKPSM